MIDVADGDPAASASTTIDRELSLYGAGLEERPQVVVLNKIDLLPEPPPFESADPRIVAVFHVSCATGAGIEELKRALFALCPRGSGAGGARPPRRSPSSRTSSSTARARERRTFRILRTDRGFRVAGRTPEDEELERALRTAGVRPGDTVEVDGEELEWE